MYKRITYVSKSGKSYEVYFDAPFVVAQRSNCSYSILHADKEFTYLIGISRRLRRMWTRTVDEATFRKLVLRFSFEKMKQWLDEGNEKNDDFCLITHNVKDYGLREDRPPSLYFDYPKICSYRRETEEGLFCKAAAPDDKTRGATKAKICENDCKVPQDFERCRHLIVETRGITTDQIAGVADRVMMRDCQIKKTGSEKECEECEDYEATVVKSDVTGESLELARRLLVLDYIKPSGCIAGNVLEAYMKSLCDSASPPIQWAETDTIFPLAIRLRNAGLISPVTWRDIQKIGTVRNMCDHWKKTPPTREEVADMIEAVGKLVGKPRPS